MVQISSIVMLAAAASVHAIPVRLNKRIAQVIVESTAKWEKACIAAGGAGQCNPISITAFSSLLAAPGPCEQQNAADSMIDLAKTLGNDPTMITLAQIFVQQPRNTPTSLSTPYCQVAPKNAELKGLFQCQFQTANPTTFVGGVAVGGPGTVPFGLQSLSPAGSCPANRAGPIPDGVQLHTLTNNPGVGAVGQAPPATTKAATTKAATTTQAVTTKVLPLPAPTQAVTTKVLPLPAPTAPASPPPAGDFKAQNGRDAQALNAKFATLTANSPCTAGENACVGGDFAQCVSGKFVTTTCGTLKCFALPLVNSRGTSITCDTEADAAARIAASGATGGITGGAASAPAKPAPAPAAPAKPAPAPAKPAPAAPAAGGFKAQNGRDAQALNAKFATLTASSACTSGENACLSNGNFAQCVNGKFVATTCGALKCFALPLVNSRGTSVTCDTEADAIARIAASGATGGLRG